MEQTDTIEKIKIKFPPLWNVILHNDDKTPMNFVTELLIEVFNKSHTEAYSIMMTVHTSGSAVVGKYSKEVAESLVSRTEQITERSNYPLKVTTEEE